MITGSESSSIIAIDDYAGLVADTCGNTTAAI